MAVFIFQFSSTAVGRRDRAIYLTDCQRPVNSILMRPDIDRYRRTHFAAGNKRHRIFSIRHNRCCTKHHNKQQWLLFQRKK